MTSRPIPPAARALVQAWEKCVLRVYDDRQPELILRAGDEAKVKGVLTAGWGHTGLSLHLGMIITQSIADAWLDLDLERAAAALERKVASPEAVAELTDNQYSALVSFVFNLGTGDPKKKEWRIWRLLRAKDYAAVHNEFARFVYDDGVKVTGLVNRRAAEQALWAKDEPGTVTANLPSSVTRRANTEPAPLIAPIHTNKGVWASLTGLGAAGLAQVNTLADQAQPYIDTASKVQQKVAPLAPVVKVIVAMPHGLVLTASAIGASCAIYGAWHVYRQLAALRR